MYNREILSRRGHAALEDTEKCVPRTVEHGLALERQHYPRWMKNLVVKPLFHFLGFNIMVPSGISNLRKVMPAEPSWTTVRIAYQSPKLLFVREIRRPQTALFPPYFPAIPKNHLAPLPRPSELTSPSRLRCRRSSRRVRSARGLGSRVRIAVVIMYSK